MNRELLCTLLTSTTCSFGCAFLISGCGSSSQSAPTPTETDSVYTAFSNPIRVDVLGFSGDIMEPGLSRDGSVLFFNDNENGKDMHFATRVNDTQFQWQNAIASINTAEVEGVPSLDDANNFYFVSTAFYAPPNQYATLFKGFWDGSTVLQVTGLEELAIQTPGMINFDLDVSADGTTLFFNDGDFRGGNGFPDAADIAIAQFQSTEWVRLPNSETIMASINTDDLEYAPHVSRDQLELFFTRLKLSDLTTEIFRASRSSVNAAFSQPQKIASIEGFVEGPVLSSDEKHLYYHRRNPNTGVFELYRVTRP